MSEPDPISGAGPCREECAAGAGTPGAALCRPACQHAAIAGRELPGPGQWCEHCKRFHYAPAFDRHKAITEGALAVQEEIDRSIIELLRKATT